MKVSEVMTPNPATVSPGDTLRHAAAMMDDLNVGALPVCDGAHLVGIITDRDITVRAIAAGKDSGCRVSEAMTDEVRACPIDADIDAAERMMQELQIRRVPVVDTDEHLVGILSLGDLATDDVRGTRETLEQVSRPSRPDR